jgi:hypothetical protein
LAASLACDLAILILPARAIARERKFLGCDFSFPSLFYNNELREGYFMNCAKSA